SRWRSGISCSETCHPERHAHVWPRVKGGILMGLLVLPVFNPPLEASHPTTGEVLARAFDALDRIADDYGLLHFTAFGDTRPVPEGYDGSPDDLDELLDELYGECDDWYDPAVGISAFRALVECIRANRSAARRLRSPKA